MFHSALLLPTPRSTRKELDWHIRVLDVVRSDTVSTSVPVAVSGLLSYGCQSANGISKIKKHYSGTLIWSETMAETPVSSHIWHLHLSGR